MTARRLGRAGLGRAGGEAESIDAEVQPFSQTNIPEGVEISGSNVPSDLRGDIFTKTKMCKFYLMGACSKGLSCVFAHSEHELNATPDLFRTKICRTLINTGHCDEHGCKYAHNKRELRSTSFLCKGKACPALPSKNRSLAVGGRQTVPKMPQQELQYSQFMPIGSQQQQVNSRPQLTQQCGSRVAPMGRAGTATSEPHAVSGGRTGASRRGRRGSGSGGGVGTGEPRVKTGNQGMFEGQLPPGQITPQTKQEPPAKSETKLAKQMLHAMQMRRVELVQDQKWPDNSSNICSGDNADNISLGNLGDLGASTESSLPECQSFRRGVTEPLPGVNEAGLPRSGMWSRQEAQVVMQQQIDMFGEAEPRDMYSTLQVMPLIDLLGSGYITVKNTFLDFEPREKQGLRMVASDGGLQDMI